MTTEVIIPVYKPGRELAILLSRLWGQTVPPDRIHIIHTMSPEDEKEGGSSAGRTGSREWYAGEMAVHPSLHVTWIRKEKFDHGGTRRMAARESAAQILIFMTQDALPADSNLIAMLLKGLCQGKKVAAAYARQLPRPDCRLPERYYRSFSYPEQPAVRSQEDAAKLGIRTYFCSDVCAAYRKDCYEKAGGFPEKTIFNEDMICTGRLLQHGYQCVYVPEAMVIHSHNYSCSQQFHRNFDLGVSHAQFPEIFGAFVSEGEGFSMVAGCVRFLLRSRRPDLVFYLGMQTVCKYAGYRLGKAYRRLPRPLLLRCTGNPGYWQQRTVSVHR